MRTAVVFLLALTACGVGLREQTALRHTSDRALLACCPEPMRNTGRCTQYRDHAQVCNAAAACAEAVDSASLAIQRATVARAREAPDAALETNATLKYGDAQRICKKGGW